MPIRTGLAIALTALAALAPASALAAPDPDGRRAGEDERIRADGGTLWFFHHDEIVKVQDTRRDGLGVRAYLIGVGTHQLEDRGAGGGPRTLDASVPEGQRVELKLCYFDEYGNQTQCSQRQSAIA